MELLLRGFTDEAWKVELAEIQRRRVELEAVIAAAANEPAPPALHPRMAENVSGEGHVARGGPRARR